MSLVAHRFGRVEFRIFVVVFYRQAQLKNQNKYSKFDTSKSMSYQGQKTNPAGKVGPKSPQLEILETRPYRYAKFSKNIHFTNPVAKSA